jgi:tripartite-type tricarboxylate transporter receptor subunit TctC
MGDSDNLRTHGVALFGPFRLFAAERLLEDFDREGTEWIAQHRKRSPMLPDVPTSYEQGLPEFDCAPFYAVFVPSGTPQPVIDKLAEALNKGLSEESVQKRLAELGADIVEPSRRGPKALADLVKSESARLLPILKKAAEK